MIGRLPLLRDDVVCYATAQTDRARLAVRLVATRLAVALFLLFAVSAVFVLAAGRMLAGMAGGLTTALDGNAWLADLILGVAVLALLGVAATTVAKSGAKRRWQKLEQRYRKYAPDPATTSRATEAANHAR